MGIFWGWDQWELPWFIFPICIIVPNRPDFYYYYYYYRITSCLMLGAGLVELKKDACKVWMTNSMLACVIRDSV